MINDALRSHLRQQDKTLEETIRKVIREELQTQGQLPAINPGVLAGRPSTGLGRATFT